MKVFFVLLAFSLIDVSACMFKPTLASAHRVTVSIGG